MVPVCRNVSLSGRSLDNRHRSSQVKSPIGIPDFDSMHELDGLLIGPKRSPRRQWEVPMHAQIRVRILREFDWDWD